MSAMSAIKMQRPQSFPAVTMAAVLSGCYIIPQKQCAPMMVPLECSSLRIKKTEPPTGFDPASASSAAA